MTDSDSTRQTVRVKVYPMGMRAKRSDVKLKRSGGKRGRLLEKVKYDPLPGETPNHREYIASKAWDKKRREALKKAHYRCQRCGASNVVLHVHHKTYDRLGSEHHSDLMVLCRKCHQKTHDKLIRAKIGHLKMDAEFDAIIGRNF